MYIHIDINIDVYPSKCVYIPEALVIFCPLADRGMAWSGVVSYTEGSTLAVLSPCLKGDNDD
jgi:hypothetical protein